MALNRRAPAAVAAALFASLACSTSPAPAPSDAGDGTVDVQILSLSTWLGQLDPVSETDAAGATHEYGGLGALSAYFAADRAAVPATILLAAMDSFGGSPPLSSQFADEPAVDGLGFLGVTAASLSNHDFNGGTAFLRHLVDRARFPFVASNLNDVVTAVSPQIQVPFSLFDVGGARVGVVALTRPDAPNHTSPGNFGPITISPPVAAANTAASAARAAGAQVVVATTDLETTGVAPDGTRSGPLVDFAAGLSGVDVVVGYKQDAPAVSRVGGALVVEHTWKGRVYGRTRVHLDHGVVTSATADLVSPDVAKVTPDPNAEALLAPYRARLATLFDGSVALATGVFPLDGGERTGEVAIGDLVADAYLAKYAPEGAQIAVMNGAGIRDALPSSYAPTERSLRRPVPGYQAGPPYDVVVGDAYTILPFGDFCALRTIPGSTLWLMLEQSVIKDPAPNTGYLQVAGFKFTYQASAPAGARVQSVTLDDGTAVGRQDTRPIKMVDTDYLDSGGDDYGMLVQAALPDTRDVAAEVLLAYLKSASPFAPAVRGRITRLP